MNTVDLQVHRHRLAGIAEEMGDVLQRTAFSPNIKERRDFSCAICDAEGRLVAQAAHIPVHLGAVPATMKFFLNKHEPKVGEGYLLNDPYSGGTHLPDISYILPVSIDKETTAFLVNRAHHTDIGGGEAGSMSSASHIDDEGFRTGPRQVTESGELDRDCVRDLLDLSRTPRRCLTDLEAQIASARRGRQRLNKWSDNTNPAVEEIFRELMKYSEQFVLRCIDELPDTSIEVEGFLDDDGFGEEDIPLRLSLQIKGQAITFDYTETADQVTGNLNCPRAVTASSTYYVVRCLVGEDVPMNQGIIRPLNILTRKGSLLDAEHPAPVAGGNVETSQRIVDVILRAIDGIDPGRVPGASQGTMNNVTFGTKIDGEYRSYYETLGGGAGGGPNYKGINGRQTHMTNTQNTPIEEFERRFPLRIDRLKLRTDSGGDGDYAGGDGLIKSWTALDEITVSLLTERRRYSPYGLRASDGLPGLNYIDNDEKKNLPAKTSFELQPGDTLTIETPGGGGWSPAD